MTENQERQGERIAKTMARAGLCSRREAEEWIAAGRVAVNGKVLQSPAFNVSADDRIAVDGKPLAQRERTRLFLFHKPRGTVTTAHDPQGRPTVFDALPEGLPRLVTIGRLDINTEGLLLLTNDGGLARALELPATGWLRRYRVRAHGETDQAVLDRLREGIIIDGIDYRGIEARLDREQGSNVWLTIGLREGKNREVKKVLEHIGLDVNRLIRVSFGPFQLGELEEGEVEEIKTRILKDQLGDKIASLAGADFDAPVQDERPGRGRAQSGERDGGRETYGTERPRQERAKRDRPDRERPARGRPDGKGAGGFRRARKEREAQEAEAPPRKEKPSPGKRKHVSAMREERGERMRGAGERRRIEKAETADRRGRTVPVERVVAAGGKSQRDDGPRKSNRNAERFSRMREERSAGGNRGEAPLRKRSAKKTEGGESKFRKTAERGRRHEHPRREENDVSPRKPWKEGEKRPPRQREFAGRDENRKRSFDSGDGLQGRKSQERKGQDRKDQDRWSGREERPPRQRDFGTKGEDKKRTFKTSGGRPQRNGPDGASVWSARDAGGPRKRAPSRRSGGERPDRGGRSERGGRPDRGGGREGGRGGPRPPRKGGRDR